MECLIITGLSGAGKSQAKKYIEDLGYFVAEDIGGGVKGDHIDIYLNTHKEAIQRGTLKGKRKKVYLMKLI